jgi:hypothetical protein
MHFPGLRPEFITQTVRQGVESTSVILPTTEADVMAAVQDSCVTK